MANKRRRSVCGLVTQKRKPPKKKREQASDLRSDNTDPFVVMSLYSELSQRANVFFSSPSGSFLRLKEMPPFKLCSFEALKGYVVSGNDDDEG